MQINKINAPIESINVTDHDNMHTILLDKINELIDHVRKLENKVDPTKEEENLALDESDTVEAARLREEYEEIKNKKVERTAPLPIIERPVVIEPEVQEAEQEEQQEEWPN